jgi:hypothetical protein
MLGKASQQNLIRINYALTAFILTTVFGVLRTLFRQNLIFGGFFKKELDFLLVIWYNRRLFK